MRMNGYYFGFAGTGVEAIDRVLCAVACAGKAYHSTEYWTDESEPQLYEPSLRGESFIEAIQNAAIDAAQAQQVAIDAAVAAERERAWGEAVRMVRAYRSDPDLVAIVEAAAAEGKAS